MQDNNLQLNQCILDIASRGENCEQSLNTLYEILSGKMYALALIILKNKAEAMDAVQDAFLCVVTKAHMFKADNATAWILTITRNICKNMLRTKKHVTPLTNNHDIAIPSVSEDAISVKCAIDNLEDIQRQLIVMKYYQDFTIRQMAKATRRSPRYIMKKITQIEEYLKKILQ